MIVRAVKIDQGVADVFQDRQRSRRAIDELTIGAGRGKCSLNNKIVAAGFDAGFDQLRIQFLQFFAGENRFRSTNVGAGADERLVGAFAQQKLERADDDRFARAGLTGDGGETRRNLPLELFHEREIFNSEQNQNSRHFERLRDEG